MCKNVEAQKLNLQLSQKKLLLLSLLGWKVNKYGSNKATTLILTCKF